MDSIIKRLEDRRDMNLRTAKMTMDTEAASNARLRADVYEMALNDVRSLAKDNHSPEEIALAHAVLAHLMPIRNNLATWTQADRLKLRDLLREVDSVRTGRCSDSKSGYRCDLARGHAATGHTSSRGGVEWL